MSDLLTQVQKGQFGRDTGIRCIANFAPRQTKLIERQVLCAEII